MNITKRHFLVTLLVPFAAGINTAAADTQATDSVTFGGLFDAYSAHDFNNPDVFDRPYTTQVLHEDQIDINLAMLETKLSTENFRGRLAVQHGTSVESNYAAEEHLFWRYIQESSFGVRLTDKLWVDAGVSWRTLVLSHLIHVITGITPARLLPNFPRTMKAE